MSVEKFISPLIAQQFPTFYKEQGPNFVAFIQAYYEWMEQSGQVLNQTRSLQENLDIDKTANSFISHFKSQYLSLLPESILVDRRLLLKYILDLYRSKGTPRAYKLLFKLLFNEEIELYIPNEHLFKSSDGVWDVPAYIEVTSSDYLDDLIGKIIYNSSGTATALVENIATIHHEKREIHIVFLKSVEGLFHYGDKILCDDLYVNTFDNKIDSYEYELLDSTEKLNYSLAVTIDSNLLVIGSLTAVSIENGGYGFSVGDIIDVSGSGFEGKFRVAAVRDENGKVIFTLLDGGSGYSMNAQVTVTGGGGTGASFKIGGLTNKELFYYNTDIINDYYNTQLDVSSSGMTISITNSTGTFSNAGNTVNSSANVVMVDCSPITTALVANNTFITNSALGLTLYAYRAEGSLIWLTANNDSMLSSPNLKPGNILGNSAQGAYFTINTVWPKTTVTGNGVIVSANSTKVAVNQVNGYFIPFGILKDVYTGGTVSANISSTARNTDWSFPTPYTDNLDTKIGDTLTYVLIEVGTITYLKSINPGVGYSDDPVVSILEPQIYNLRIPDGKGGFKGFNAVVNAKATNAKGIATAGEIIQSGYGYLPGESVAGAATDITNQTVVSGISIVETTGKSSGRYLSNRGFVSDTNYLQDSYFFQQYSYQIISSKMIESYDSLVRDLIHPAGIALFGKYQLKQELDSDGSLSYSNIQSS